MGDGRGVGLGDLQLPSDPVRLVAVVARGRWPPAVTRCVRLQDTQHVESELRFRAATFEAVCGDASRIS